jgi:hypothetical protein
MTDVLKDTKRRTDTFSLKRSNQLNLTSYEKDR